MTRATTKNHADAFDVPRAVPDAERNVVGCCVLNPAVVDEVFELCELGDFRDPCALTAMRCIRDMHASTLPLDMSTLREKLAELDGKGQWPTTEPPAAFIYECINQTPIFDHWRYYAKQVADQGARFRLFIAADAIRGSACEPGLKIEDAIATAESSILAIGERRLESQAAHIADVLQECMQQIERRMSGEKLGLRTGLRDLDEVIGGLQPGHLCVLAARPGRGKTTLALQIATALACDEKEPVLFVSLEMGRTELGDRLLASRAGVAHDRIRDGNLTRDEVSLLTNAQSELSTGALTVEDASQRTVGNIGALARRCKKRSGLALVVVDYLQLVKPDNPGEPRQDQVAAMSRRLKVLGRELQVPVLCLAQLNRESEREGKAPQLHHLRESGAIEQDADQVLMLHQVERQDGQEEPPLSVFVRKNRHGKTGEVKLAWNKATASFRLLSRELPPAQAYDFDNRGDDYETFR